MTQFSDEQARWRGAEAVGDTVFEPGVSISNKVLEAVGRALLALEQERDELRAAILDSGGWDERCRNAEARVKELEQEARMGDYDPASDDGVS